MNVCKCCLYPSILYTLYQCFQMAGHLKRGQGGFFVWIFLFSSRCGEFSPGLLRLNMNALTCIWAVFENLRSFWSKPYFTVLVVYVILFEINLRKQSIMKGFNNRFIDSKFGQLPISILLEKCKELCQTLIGSHPFRMRHHGPSARGRQDPNRRGSVREWKSGRKGKVFGK
jgi:hypothetical protein